MVPIWLPLVLHASLLPVLSPEGPAKQADDAMTFDDEPMEASGDDGTMTLGDEPGGPSIRSVEPPGPAAEELTVPATMAVRVTARRVVGGQIRLVPMEIRGPAALRTVRGFCSAGVLEDVDRGSEPGVFSAALRLPAMGAARIIVCAFLGDGVAGAVRIPVWAAVDLEVEAAEAGGLVEVAIGEERFGPVRAVGRRAVVPVVIPPGETAGRVITRGRDGERQETTVELPREPFDGALVVPPGDPLVADDGPVHPVLVAASDDRGGAAAAAEVSVDSGALGTPAELEPGLWLYGWRASRALGTHRFTVRAAGLETVRLIEMMEGPPLGVEIVAEPDLLPADGRSESVLYAGLSDGLGHFIDAGPITVTVQGGSLRAAPQQTGGVSVTTVVSDFMPPTGEPPPAIVVTARVGGDEGVVAIRQYHREGVGLRLFAEVARAPADGTTEVPLRVEVVDEWGDPLPIDVEVEANAMGGTVPPSVEVEDGVGRFRFRAGTQATTASVRVALDAAVAHASVQLGSLDAARLRVALEPEGLGTYRVRARLEDANGNGLPAPAEGEGALQAETSFGTLGPLAPSGEEGADAVGWLVATLTLPADTSLAADITVTAGPFRETVRVEPERPTTFYLEPAVGYAHNLGQTGVVPVRIGLGWLDAFGLPGFLFGLEAGYLYASASAETELGSPFEVVGHAATLYASFGYRLAVARHLVLAFQLGLGTEIGWFDVTGRGTTRSTDALAAFALGLRVGAGIPLGPGVLGLALTYDDARFNDLIAGNVGGLGGQIGYRFEI